MSVAVSLLLVLGAALGEPVRLERWSYRWGDPPPEDGRLPWLDPAFEPEAWKPVVLPGYAPPERSGARRLWLRVQLPDAGPVEPTLRLDAVLGGNYEVYLGAKRLLVFPGTDMTDHRAAGMPWHLIALPPGYAGQWLFIRTDAFYVFNGPMGVPALGARSELVETITRRDLLRFTVGGALVLLALLAYLILGMNRAGRLVAGYTLFTVGMGAYTLHYTQLKDLVFPSPVVWWAIWALSIPVATVGMLDFIIHAFPSGPVKLARRLLKAHLGYSAVLLGFQLVAALLIASLTDAWLRAAFLGVGILSGGHRLFVFATVLWVTATLVPLARKGDRDAVVFLSGMAAMLLTITRDVLGSVGLIGFEWHSYLHWGVLAFSVALAVLLQRRYAEAQARLSTSRAELLQRGREKEALLRDLHDGIGAVTTNIRLLAEVGARSDARARSALRTIAELSADGLAELRAFVETLDESGTSWTVLAAELRRYGGQLINGQGLEFNMTTRIEDGGGPSGVMSLAVLRVFREALTNIVKHAAAKTVDVELTVTTARFLLAVRDDGAGSDGSTSGTHRGLTNMRARATELEGTLTVKHEQGTEVTLDVPLEGRAKRGGEG